MKLSEFLDAERVTTQDDFERRFNHCFLLVNKAPPSTGDTGPSSFYTRAAEQAQDVLRRAHDDAEIHPILGANGNTLAKVTIGRSSINDIVLAHDAISKFHAYFRMSTQRRYTLCDPGSTNGTTVNDHALEAGHPVVLEGGETIVFGRVFEGTFHTPRTLYRHLSLLQRWARS